MKRRHFLSCVGKACLLGSFAMVGAAPPGPLTSDAAAGKAPQTHAGPIPEIDREVPAAVSTATFAMG